MTERTPERCGGTQEFKQPSLGSLPTSLSGVRGDGCLAAAACVLGCHPKSVPILETEPMCSRNPWRTVRRDGKTLTFQPDCGCWGCGECRPKLKEKWVRHAQKCFRECGRTLAYLFCGAEDVESISRWLRRHGCDYFRIRRQKDRYLFIFSCDETPSMSARCSVSEACEAFTEKVNEIHGPSGGNPVSSSRSWALPQRNHSGWDTVAIGPTPAQVKAMAEETAVQCREKFGMTICSGEMQVIDRLCAMIASSVPKYPTRPVKMYGNTDILPEDSMNDYHGMWGSQDEELESWRMTNAVEN